MVQCTGPRCVSATLKGHREWKDRLPLGPCRGKRELGVPGRTMLKVVKEEFWEGLLAEETTGRMIASVSRPVVCHEGSELLLLWELKACSQDTDAQS